MLLKKKFISIYSWSNKNINLGSEPNFYTGAIKYVFYYVIFLFKQLAIGITLLLPLNKHVCFI